MPVELLSLSPAYCVGASRVRACSGCACDDAVDDSLYNVTVGAYRLVHDPKLYGPIWQRSQRSLKRALLLAVPYALVAFPLTRLWVTFILARSPLSPKDIHNAAYLGISPVTYTTWTLTLGQLSMLVEWMLARELKKSRSEVYERTVESRGKRALARLSSCSYEPRLTSAPCPGSTADEWWQPYTEEWAVPPLERASRSAEKQSFYARLASPLVRMILLKGAPHSEGFGGAETILTRLFRRSLAHAAQLCARLELVHSELHPRFDSRSLAAQAGELERR